MRGLLDPRDHEAVLACFHRVADAVAEHLAVGRDWGESGRRPGQFLADLDADDVAVTMLHAAGFAVLSEESGRSGPVAGAVVVVDPLDGSTNASRSVPWYATALCLVHDGRPTVALVANQASGARYWATHNGGAWCDGRRLRASSCEDIAAAVIAISGLPTRHHGWAQFRALGAIALDLCLVADGALDGFVDMSPDAHGVWDYLAGALICAEAGGSVVDAAGRNLLVLDHAARRTPVAAGTPTLLASLVDSRRDP